MTHEHDHRGHDHQNGHDELCAGSASRDPKIILPGDIDPHHRWDRPIQAPGQMQVDFEERVNFRRLHAYRLARVRQALARSDLGALLSFDQHNIRYTTSTVIGEWARDKLTRYSLLTGNGDPYVWDFGSAARHHRLHAPWLHQDHCRAGLLGLRGAVHSDAGLFSRAAEEIKSILQAEGVADTPLGVDVIEPPMMFALQRVGIEVRDSQQVMLEARQLKSSDEITLLNMAASMVDGVYQDIYEALKPGVRENQVVALANKRLYEMGSDCVESINAISGERCCPHPHNFTDRLIRPGDQAFFDIIQSFMGYRTCYYRTFSVGRASEPQVTAYQRAREWMDRAIELIRPGRDDRQDRAGVPELRRDRLRDRDGGLRPEFLPRPGAGPARAAHHLAADLAGRPHGTHRRHGLRGGNLLSRDRRRIGGTDRGGNRRYAARRAGDQPVPRAGTAHRQPLLRPGPPPCACRGRAHPMPLALASMSGEGKKPMSENTRKAPQAALPPETRLALYRLLVELRYTEESARTTSSFRT